MKILYIYLYSTLGGVASVLYNRIGYLKKKGHVVELLFLYDYGGLDFWKKKNINVKICCNKKTIIKRIYKNKYDIITIIDSPGIFEILNKIFSKKIIYEIHTTIEASFRKLKPRITREFSRVIVPSNYLKKICVNNLSIKEDIIKVIPNCIDKDLFRYQPHVKSAKFRIIAWIGKLDFVHKNLHEAIKIFKKIKDSRHRVIFWVITGGMPTIENENFFMAELSKYNLIRDTLWIHNFPYEDMPTLYSKIAKSRGMMISTSLDESFGMAVHEAIRCKVPIVSSKVGAIPEIITDGYNGFLYDFGDINKAANKVLKLLDDKRLYNRFRTKHPELIIKFDTKKIMEDYLDFISGYP